MSEKLMILPAGDAAQIRLIRIPEDFEQHEAYRYVTGLIAEVEEKADYNWDDIADLLEDRGFASVEFVLGPAID